MAEKVAFWWATKDGDVECLEFFRRHYTSRRRRRLNQFVGPGQKRVYRSRPGEPVSALFAWRKFKDDCIDERTGKPQDGVNCAIFRNESLERSSALIRQADAIADFCWADRRHYTYVDPSRVASAIPGYCFIRAGWKRCGVTKGGLVILERVRSSSVPASQASKGES